MKILLIPAKGNYPNPKPNIGIMGQGFPYLAGALNKAGHEVFGLDMNYECADTSAQIALTRLVEKAIREFQPDLIGVGGLSADYCFIRDTMTSIRRISPDIPVVCGGGIVTYDREYVFTHLQPDFAVTGDAEETIVSLAAHIEKGTGVANLANVAYWKNNEPVYNDIEHPKTSLDDIPLPDYSPFDYDRFLRNFNQIDNFYTHTRPHPRIMPISLGRSCPFRCTFCVHSQPGRAKYRQRSIDSAINEIAYFYNKYEFNILFIYDELFSTRKERVLDFCRKINYLKNHEKMDFDWTCDLRVENADKSVLKEMKEAGCTFVGWGLESASQTVLDSMKKGISAKQIKHAIDLSNEVGIGFQGNFIFGDIAETYETFQETLHFYNAYCRDLIVHLNPLTPYPGCKLFEHCIQAGIINDRNRYYEWIRPFKRYEIGMTTMSATELGKSLRRLLKAQQPVNFKKAAIESCAETEEFTDLEFPQPQRRRLYDITVACPHCMKLINYLCPLSPVMSAESELLTTYCTACHKRIVIAPPDNLPGRTKITRFRLFFLKARGVILNLAPAFTLPALRKVYYYITR